MNRALHFLNLLLLLVILCSSPQTALGDAFANVTEASNYSLVYELDIPEFANYQFGNPSYTVDNSASTGFFDRVAYYLELDSGSGPEYVYAWMDAFTTDPLKLGVPTVASGAIHQQIVDNLNIFSNHSGITPGTGISTGNLEFWPSNSLPDAGSIPGADSRDFDFGDQPFPGNYGSMQLHNYGAGETLFAYNQWGGIRPTLASDLGIGTQPSGRPDWTGSRSASDYTVRKLQVLARPATPPPLLLSSPTGRLVQQRGDDNRADVVVEGFFAGTVSQIEARAVPIDGFHGTATDWTIVDAAPSGGTFSSTLSVPAGWYNIETRSLLAGQTVSEASVSEIGVGDVFVIAGQSNSANFGSSALVPDDPRVSAFRLDGWQLATDPQPLANGSGGSPWPALGDALVEEWNVPIGLISVGVGGTRVDQWLPDGSLYGRLGDVLEMLGPDGLRAVLWHQGESDNEANTSSSDYEQRLEAIIAQSRTDAGFEVPWGIAQASFVPYLDPTTNPGIIAAQAAVANDDPLNFVGAFTDDLINPAGRDTPWRYDDLHFNEAGLREHADRWAEVILQRFPNLAVPEPTGLAICLVGIAVSGGILRKRV